jgi:hypothetical protein
MKYFFSITAILFFATIHTQAQQLVKLWETPANIAVPESVLPHKNKLYISLVDGNGWDEDGKGGIGIMNNDGTNYNGNLVSGLSAPKGMGIIGKKLYAANINKIEVINIKSGKRIQTISVPQSENLNDITIDKKTVYISDSKAGTIWKLKKGKPILYLDNAPHVNGLKFYKNELYYGEGKNLKKINRENNITNIVTLPQEIDGIEFLKNGDCIVSAWVGYIYYVRANGEYKTLLETHQNKLNTADIGVNKTKNIVYVPTFYGKTIVAYKIVE